MRSDVKRKYGESSFVRLAFSRATTLPNTKVSARAVRSRAHAAKDTISLISGSYNLPPAEAARNTWSSIIQTCSESFWKQTPRSSVLLWIWGQGKQPSSCIHPTFPTIPRERWTPCLGKSLLLMCSLMRRNKETLKVINKFWLREPS